eukprot:TRINITY_DN6213_c0_g2_i1.p1 TRINITY_DN6213_c0_g2~~TRINITY_DN6213_c0_g2_i1.p1  ORF type:complete len:612 (-),score=64.49 TRINITY_DN6213_c0_g2_i1:308-2143(-)
MPKREADTVEVPLPSNGIPRAPGPLGFGPSTTILIEPPKPSALPANASLFAGAVGSGHDTGSGTPFTRLPLGVPHPVPPGLKAHDVHFSPISSLCGSDHVVFRTWSQTGPPVARWHLMDSKLPLCRPVAFTGQLPQCCPACPWTAPPDVPGVAPVAGTPLPHASPAPSLMEATVTGASLRNGVLPATQTDRYMASVAPWAMTTRPFPTTSPASQLRPPPPVATGPGPFTHCPCCGHPLPPARVITKRRAFHLAVAKSQRLLDAWYAVTTWDAAIPYMGSGDLILFRGGSTFSKGIMLLTRAIVSHAAMIVRTPHEDDLRTRPGLARLWQSVLEAYHVQGEAAANTSGVWVLEANIHRNIELIPAARWLHDVHKPVVDGGYGADATYLWRKLCGPADMTSWQGSGPGTGEGPMGPTPPRPSAFSPSEAPMMHPSAGLLFEGGGSRWRWDRLPGARGVSSERAVAACEGLLHKMIEISHKDFEENYAELVAATLTTTTRMNFSAPYARKATGQLFCSEMVTHCLKAIGLLSPSLQEHTTTPGVLMSEQNSQGDLILSDPFWFAREVRLRLALPPGAPRRPAPTVVRPPVLALPDDHHKVWKRTAVVKHPHRYR